MTTAYTSLLGLALPVTGELSGTWGDTVNNSITSLVDTAVAGTTNVSADSNVTLTTTTGASNQARQAILLFSGARTAIRTVTAPAQSKIYTVINATTGGFAVQLVGAGPTTGVTIVAGESAVCAWNGSDFVKVSNTGGSGTFTNLTVTGIATFSAGSAAAPAITTTGDTNTGIFFPAADTIAFAEGGVEAMRLDANGDMGIQVGNVNSKFGKGNGYCGNSSATASGYLDPYNGSTGNTMLYNTGAFNILFGTNNTERARIDSSGSMGIGTTSPARKLVVSNAGAQGFEVGPGGGLGSGNEFLNYNRSTSLYVPSVNYSSSYIFHVGTGGNIRAVDIDSSGNVGIGTTSPSSFGKLAVVGNVSLNTNGQLKFYNSGNNNWAFIDNPSTDGTAPMRFAPGGSEAMRLDGSGNLLLGTTTTRNKLTVAVGEISSPTLGTASGAAFLGNTTAAYGTMFGTSGNGDGWIQQQRVDGTATAYNLLLNPSGGNVLVGITSSGGAGGISLYPNGSGSSGQVAIAKVADGVTNNAMAFLASGSVIGTVAISNTNTAYNTSSDYRLKNTIAPMTGALAKVALLKPCTYKWNVDGSDGQGFIAHELAEVCPQAVTGKKDAVDAKGNPQYQGIDVSFLVATLTAAIQEQQAIIESLKARLDAANL